MMMKRKRPNGKIFTMKKMLKDNKGLTYLLVSSLLVVVLIGIFFATKKYTYQDKADLYFVKIRTMNDFVKNLNSDIHRATHVSAFRTMIALEDRVANSGEFLDNVSESFKETFYNGTINGTDVEIMSNSSFKDYILKVQSLAGEVGIMLNATVEEVHLSQSNPWDIDINVSILINMTDSGNKVSWVMRKDYYTSVPIENLRDPIYSVNTLNKIPNSVIRCNFTVLVTSDNDTRNLETCINQSYYLESGFAPSFLMRFEGNTSTDPNGNGIESIVYIPVLSAQELPVSVNAVKVDYIYFGNITVSNKICDVQNIDDDSKFVIPLDRRDMYNVTGLNYSTTCP